MKFVVAYLAKNLAYHKIWQVPDIKNRFGAILKERYFFFTSERLENGKRTKLRLQNLFLILKLFIGRSFYANGGGGV